jgi:integrase
VLTADKTKTSRSRSCYLTCRAVEALDALENRGHLFFASPRDPSRSMSRRYLYDLFTKAVARSGIKPGPDERLTYHSLRSSWCYIRRVVDRWPERRIMASGGWASNAVMKRYGIEDLAEMDEAMAEVEQRLAGERIGPKGKPPTGRG